MDDELSEEESARAIAPLLEVMQNGKLRPATAADVLELTSSGGARYVLKDAHGKYLAGEPKLWSTSQRDGVIIPDRDTARELSALGLAKHGVATRVIRIRRRGTCGIEAVRLRPEMKTTIGDSTLSFAVGPEGAMALLAAMSGAKEGEGVQ